MEATASSAGPAATTRWRCRQCGNLTRFDVVRRARVQEFVHQTLAGDPVVEETTVLEEVVEQVRCRWCGGVGTVELVARPDAAPTADQPGAAVRTAEPGSAAVASAGTGEASVRTADPLDGAGGPGPADRP